MSILLFKIISRLVYYSMIYFWFSSAVPVLWDHGSSFSLEMMFGVSFSIIIITVYFEIFMSEKKRKKYE